MREEDFKPVMARLEAICAKHSYDRDTVDRQLLIIDSDLGVPVIRKTLSTLFSDHHYQLTALFAELLTKDRRSSYRALGETYTRKCAKAPTESPHLLRLRDRAKEGLSCFVVKYAVSNPWNNSVTPAKCVRMFAASAQQAGDRATEHAAALIPGGKPVNLRVVNILDDPDAEKAEVTAITMTCEATEVLGTTDERSFAGASAKLLAWHQQFRLSHPDAAVSIKAEWENGASYSFSDWLDRVAVRGGANLGTVIQQDIAFVFGEFVYPDKSAQEQATLHRKLMSMGAKEHCGYIRESCLLRDSRVAADGGASA